VRSVFAKRPRWHGPLAGVAALSVGLGLGAVALGAAHQGTSPSGANHLVADQSSHQVLESPSVHKRDGLGIAPGKIKHVWFIILENKSYDATFSGLNNNTYLWQNLPAQGALLTQYYGTGHYSQDNYIGLASGQAPQQDTQVDCPAYTAMAGHVDLTGNILTNPNYGQEVSGAGANGAPGTNGCVYPSDVPTLFNQMDAAHVSWKGYAQDLSTSTAPANPVESGAGMVHSTGEASCGAPYAAPGAIANKASYPNPGSATATDQYVPKHFPFPWFSSLLNNPNDCNAAHIANVFDPVKGLYHDLQHASTTPAFSWISPNNCSDAHDAVCHGNNLSGGWADPNTPNAPINYTGGLYASDLFLEHIVPEIEASPAFKQGGLIDISFDEGFPAFTYTGNSFNNAPITLESPNASASIKSDSAAETINGQTVYSEPTGPNTPLATDPTTGYQLYPGPGYNAFIDRPGTNYTARTDTNGAHTIVSATSGASQITDSAISATDIGRPVSGTGIPANAFVGQVFNNATTATQAAGAGTGSFASTGAFTLVNATGAQLTTTAAVTSVTLAARTAQTDPLFNATDATPGGGDVGAVLISPFIKPGTVSSVAYNHYSWLRTMEDLFHVARKSPGLDGKGHIGYAAQPGLAPFGPDVFTNVNAQVSDNHEHRN